VKFSPIDAVIIWGGYALALGLLLASRIRPRRRKRSSSASAGSPRRRPPCTCSPTERSRTVGVAHSPSRRPASWLVRPAPAAEAL